MLKMGIGEFYDLTPRELQNAIKGHLDFEDSVQQNEWERTRWQTAVLVNIQMPRGKSISPQQLVEFPWEKKKRQIGPKLTPEQVKERLAKWQRKY